MPFWTTFVDSAGIEYEEYEPMSATMVTSNGLFEVTQRSAHSHMSK